MCILFIPDLWKGYMDLGPPTKIYRKCKLVIRNEERNNKGAKNSDPTFPMCCRDDQVILDHERKPPLWRSCYLEVRRLLISGIT